jgi:nitroreductase
VEWSDVVRKRRMVRDFTDEPVDSLLLDQLLDDARRVPTAGFSQGIDFVVLEGEQTEIFWKHTMEPDVRASFQWPGLLRAPTIVLPIADASAYLDRYSQPDKARAGLGAAEDAWPVPYWFIDTGMAGMALLYGVVNAGLGALFFGIFRNEAALLVELGVPAGKRPIGAIAIGHPTPAAQLGPKEGSPSRRPRRPLEAVIHRGAWNTANT